MKYLYVDINAGTERLRERQTDREGRESETETKKNKYRENVGTEIGRRMNRDIQENTETDEERQKVTKEKRE